MGYKNELNVGLKNRRYGSPCADRVETKGWRVADDRRRPVRDLANCAVGFRLMRLVAVEGFNGRQTDKSCKGQESC